MPPCQQHPGASDGLPLKLFALAFGAVLGLALLKFPNPSVMEHFITKPTNEWEWILTAWPVRYGQVLVWLMVLAGVPLMRWPGAVSKRCALLPVAWLAWVGISSTQTINPRLSLLVLTHFATGFACFVLGVFVLGRLKSAGWLFAGLSGAFLVVVVTGWGQHFGGLKESQHYFFTYVYPTLTDPLPELLKKMKSERVFSTLFYPNSLAGALLLIAPLMFGALASARERMTLGARWLLAVIVMVGSGGCLLWSGSKAGWLLALGLAVLALLRLPIRRQIKIVVVVLMLAMGLGGFIVRHLGFFQRGATSVVARFDYWRAGGQNIAAHPVLGSGPGTFGKVYAQLKLPEAEMAQLAHNDYLQQASDSGVVAGILFFGMVAWILVATRAVWREGDWLKFGVWLGLFGFAVQSVVEFGFYIPATAWCWFGLAGWLLGRSGLRFDNPKVPA